jgi:hypothetical protein
MDYDTGRKTGFGKCSKTGYDTSWVNGLTHFRKQVMTCGGVDRAIFVHRAALMCIPAPMPLLHFSHSSYHIVLDHLIAEAALGFGHTTFSVDQSTAA